jgi:(p)ppGpp synthase/HD superfamily hydrolase
MLVLATTKHAGQYDKGGKPYILHPLKVMHYLRSDDEELNCIALGHDLVEDCRVTYQQLKEQGFSTRIIAGISALTKVPGETEDECLARILANKDACLVKMQDLRHNSDIRRLKGLTEKDFARMQKYSRWYLTIKEHLEKT